jgi:hypothetical protein
LALFHAHTHAGEFHKSDSVETPSQACLAKVDLTISCDEARVPDAGSGATVDSYPVGLRCLAMANAQVADFRGLGRLIARLGEIKRLFDASEARQL